MQSTHIQLHQSQESKVKWFQDDKHISHGVGQVQVRGQEPEFLQYLLEYQQNDHPSGSEYFEYTNQERSETTATNCELQKKQHKSAKIGKIGSKKKSNAQRVMPKIKKEKPIKKEKKKQHQNSKIIRRSFKNQSNLQRMISKIKNGASILKNVPSQTWRHIKHRITYLSPEHKTQVQSKPIVKAFWSKKRLNIKQLKSFIRETKLSSQIWALILNQKEINRTIEQSNKLATSQFFTGKYALYLQFLREINKKMEKIIYRSVIRVVESLRHGGKFISYLDSSGHDQLHQLDNEYLSNSIYSQNYSKIIQLVNQQPIDQQNLKQ